MTDNRCNQCHPVCDKHEAQHKRIREQHQKWLAEVEERRQRTEATLPKGYWARFDK